jgi:hypothetical protein
MNGGYKSKVGNGLIRRPWKKKKAVDGNIVEYR